MCNIGEQIAASFGTSTSFLEANLTGLGEESASVSGGAGGSTAHWVLGHVVYWRNQLLVALGAAALWSEDAHPDLRGVERGDLVAPPTRSFAQLLADLERTTGLLDAALRGCDDGAEALQMAAFLASHEAYHAGQLGVLRRVVGLPGGVGQG